MNKLNVIIEYNSVNVGLGVAILQKHYKPITTQFANKAESSKALYFQLPSFK